MSDPATPTRSEALKLIERDRARTLDLLDALPAEATEAPGVGGGSWSPADLIGHLESWEEYALDAIGAWEQGRPSRLDELQATLDTDGINAADVGRKAGRSYADARAAAARTHAELLAAIRAIPEARWAAPAEGDDRSIGQGIGGILGGPAGPFRHDEAHHADLETFLRADGGGGVGRTR